MHSPTKPLFRYPLCLECLSLIGLLCLLVFILSIISVFSYVVSGGAPLYVLSILAVAMIINTFLEYGLEIIETTSIGKNEAPAFSNDFFRILNGRGRFPRQLLMLLLFAGLIMELEAAGFDYLAALAACFLLVLFPASLVLNALYESLFETLNPISLIAFMLMAGSDYLIAIASLIIITWLLYLSTSLGLFGFLLFLPLALFLLLIYFRFLGLIAESNMGKLFPQRDDAEEQSRIDQYFADNEKLLAVIEQAYWQMKDGRLLQVIDLIDPVIRLQDWARFDFVFDAISKWPNTEAALHFLKLYLPHLIQKQDSMRALMLCQWALRQNTKFYPESNKVLEAIVAASASQEQYVVAVKLLENFVDGNSQQESANRYLLLAADICQSKLHHEEKFAALKTKLANLES